MKPTLWKEIQLRGASPPHPWETLQSGVPPREAHKGRFHPRLWETGVPLSPGARAILPAPCSEEGCPAMPSRCPGPETHEGHPPVSSPPSPRLLLLYGAAVGKALSENRCLFGEFKAPSWRSDSGCTLKYVCLNHYAVIHVYFRHQCCLEIFSSSQCYLYALIFPFASALTVCSGFPESLNAHTSF